MNDDRTISRHLRGVPVRTLKVEVLGGPDAGRVHTASETDSIAVGTAEGNDLVLGDPTVSRYHLELRRQDPRVFVVDHGSKNGTRIGPVVLRSAQAEIAVGATLEIGETLLRVVDGDVVMVDVGPQSVGALIGAAPSMRRLMATTDTVAKSDVPVLVLGESGTGKELVARAIHDSSPRRSAPFVTVDCGAIAPSLFTSELFGHERGAFTGADRRHEGAFERARGGTVFLDEIGELPSELQPALLGALERKRIRRVGGTAEIAIDVRVIAATNRDLRAAVNAGTFRLDLYYRLAVVLLHIPALRDRPEDISVLASHFLVEAGETRPAIDVFGEEMLARMQAYAWPGNARELRNVVEAAVATGQPSELGDPQAAQRSSVAPPTMPSAAIPTYRDARAATLHDFEARYLRSLMEATGNNLRRASREAQLDRTYLRELLRKHNVRS